MLESPTINVSPGQKRRGLHNDGGRYSLRRHLKNTPAPSSRESGMPKGASIKNRSPPALLLGDHSVSDPPDPISNSAVKPDRADGTNAQALEE